MTEPRSVRAGPESSSPEPFGAPALEALGVSASFGDRAVLRGLDLALAAGQRLAVLGRNGAGKTTLVRILAGALRPIAGQVRVHGRPFQSDPAGARSSIGVLGHQSYLYPELTVAENLTLYARLYRAPGQSRHVEELLELVGLSDRRAERVATLSRGMIQRLALARAVVHDPPILLLDEPDTGLDERALATLEAILDLRGPAGRTVLLTTHDLEHALRFGHEVAILHRGRIVERRPSCLLDVADLRQLYAARTAERSPADAGQLAGRRS